MKGALVASLLGGLVAFCSVMAFFGLLQTISLARSVHAQEQPIGMEVEMKQVILDEGTAEQRCYDVFTRGLSGLEVRAFPCPER